MGILGFSLLFIGTTGLLFNDFIFEWGRMATLIFAVVNVVGFLAAGLDYLRINKEK